MKTLADIKNFTEGIVITEIYSDDFEYSFYFLGDESLGWAEYVDLSSFEIFEMLGFTQEIYRIEDGRDYDPAATGLYSFVAKYSSLEELLTEVSADSSDFELIRTK